MLGACPNSSSTFHIRASLPEPRRARRRWLTSSLHRRRLFGIRASPSRSPRASARCGVPMRSRSWRSVSLPSAISSGSAVTLVSWISQTFLQLVLLSIIIVGQNVLAGADKRSEASYEDADACFTPLWTSNGTWKRKTPRWKRSWLRCASSALPDRRVRSRVDAVRDCRTGGGAVRGGTPFDGGRWIGLRSRRRDGGVRRCCVRFPASGPEVTLGLCLVRPAAAIWWWLWPTVTSWAVISTRSVSSMSGASTVRSW